MTLKLNSAGSPQDAPAFLRLKFAEIANEILEDSSTYEGWISKGWIQEEFIHIDVLPCELKLPRRYAFRYLEVLALDTSQKFQVVVEDAELTAVSAVSMDAVKPVEGLPEDLQKIDRASLKRCRTACSMCSRTAPSGTAGCGWGICASRPRPAT